MAMSFAESFIRAYAERAVRSIEVTIDKGSGTAQLSFYGRSAEVNLREMVLKEDAFRSLGNAVNSLLGIPEQKHGSEPPPAFLESAT